MRSNKGCFLIIGLIFFFSVLYAKEIPSGNGFDVWNFNLQISLKEQTKIGFTSAPAEIDWDKDVMDSPDITISLSGQNPEKMYFYYQRYAETGCSIAVTPKAMGSDLQASGLSPINYRVTFTEVDKNGASLQSGNTTVSSDGGYMVFEYEGGEPEIHIYNLDFELTEEDLPTIISGAYSGKIFIEINETG